MTPADYFRMVIWCAHELVPVTYRDRLHPHGAAGEYCAKCGTIVLVAG